MVRGRCKVILMQSHTQPPFPARSFASSLESLSSCGMKTIHPVADPHIRVELTNFCQYCGVTNSPSGGTKNSGKRGITKKRKLDDGRDHFDDYRKSVFEDWDACKKLVASCWRRGVTRQHRGLPSGLARTSFMTHLRNLLTGSSNLRDGP